MRIGTPREIKNHEYRVGLTPAGARELCAHGHEVFIEAGAGRGIGIAVDAHVRVGATVLRPAGGAVATAEMCLQVTEPQRTAGSLQPSPHGVYNSIHRGRD